MRVGRQIITEVETGRFIAEPTRLTVAEFLHAYLDEHARHHVAPRVLESNRYLIRDVSDLE